MTDSIVQNVTSPPGFKRIYRAPSPVFSTRPKRIWLISFTDFMSLMVAFFVMFYSMSDPRLGDLKKIAEALSENAGREKTFPETPFSGPPAHMGDSDIISLPRVARGSGLDPRYVRDILGQKKIQVPGVENWKILSEGPDTILIVPVSDVIGDKGLIEREAILLLVDLLRGVPNAPELVLSASDVSFGKMVSGLVLGQKISQALYRYGYTEPTSILLNVDSSGTDSGTFSIRLQKFVAH